MVILAFIIIVITIILSIYIGIKILAKDLYKQNRISYIEYDYMCSFEYLMDKIKFILSRL